MLAMATRDKPAARRDIVVIGASAGGIEALTRLVGQLPRFIPLRFLPGAERPLVLAAVRRTEADVVHRAPGAQLADLDAHSAEA